MWDKIANDNIKANNDTIIYDDKCEIHACIYVFLWNSLLYIHDLDCNIILVVSTMRCAAISEP